MEPKIASSGSVRVVVRAAVFAAALAAAPNAPAQTPTSAERAQHLFDEGRELLRQERYAEACAKLAESQALDPGGGTLLNLGICRRREGRTATAFALLTEALAEARAAGRSDRVATAERNLAELEPTLSRLVVVPPAQGLPPNALVQLDGSELPPSTPNAPLPLDPGEHELSVSAPAYRAFSAKFSLGSNADTARITIPELEPAAAPAPAPALVMPALPPSPAESATPPPSRPPVPVSDSRAPVPPLAYALLAGGGVTLAAGTYFGIEAFTKRSVSDRHYDGGHCTTESCVVAWHDAQKAALVSDITLGVGAVATAAGFYLLFGRPHEHARTSALRLGIGASGAGAFASASGGF